MATKGWRMARIDYVPAITVPSGVVWAALGGAPWPAVLVPLTVIPLTVAFLRHRERLRELDIEEKRVDRLSSPAARAPLSAHS